LPQWPTHWPPKSFTSVSTWLLAIAIAAALAWAFVAALRSNGPPLGSLTTLAIVVGIVLQFVVEGGVVAILLAAMPAMSKFSLRELGFRTPDSKTVWFAVLGAAAMVVVSNGTASLIDYFAHSTHEQDVVEIFKGLHAPWAVALFVAFAVVFAPFAEETIFRVFYFNLGLRYWGFWGGAIASGLLFGMAHGDLYAAFPLALGGMILCYVYYRTRNAWASMISHAIFNALSISLLVLAPKLVT